VVETIWETPLPYAAFGAVVGAAGIAARGRGGSLVKPVPLLAAFAGAITVAAVELAYPDPLDAVQVIALLASAVGGAVLGSTVATIVLMYVRWVRRVFRVAAERFEAAP